MPRRTEVVISPEGLSPLDPTSLDTMDLTEPIFSDSNWRIMNESVVLEGGEPIPAYQLSTVSATSDVWGTAANNRRYVAEETARLVNEMIVEDIHSPVELADAGTGVVDANNNVIRQRVYSVDEVDATAVIVPDNVDRRCVVRADRRQGIESVKTE